MKYPLIRSRLLKLWREARALIEADLIQVCLDRVSTVAIDEAEQDVRRTADDTQVATKHLIDAAEAGEQTDHQSAARDASMTALLQAIQGVYMEPRITIA